MIAYNPSRYKNGICLPTMAHGIKIKQMKVDGQETEFIFRLQLMELEDLQQINVNKEIKKATYSLLLSIGYTYMLIDRERYPLHEKSAVENSKKLVTALFSLCQLFELYPHFFLVNY